MVIVIMMTSCCLFSCSNNLKLYNKMSLEDAYEAGWLTEDDLRVIADHLNNKTYSEIPLSKEKENNIRHSSSLTAMYSSTVTVTARLICVSTPPRPTAERS